MSCSCVQYRVSLAWVEVKHDTVHNTVQPSVRWSQAYISNPAMSGEEDGNGWVFGLAFVGTSLVCILGMGVWSALHPYGG